MQKIVRTPNLIITPSDENDLWEKDWNVTLRKGEKNQIGTVSFAGEKEYGTIPIQLHIQPEYQNKGYGTDVLRAMVDWAFSFGNIYEVTAETTHTNDRCVHALNKARFVLREGDRFREFYSIKKQKTSWTGLYLFIGITIGMILTLVFDDPKVGMGIGILVSLFIGGSLDIGEKKNREKVTGKK